MPKYGRPEPKSLVDSFIASDRVPALNRDKPLVESDVWNILSEVLDPEVPVLSVVDLGIVRTVSLSGEAVSIEVTPTYSGCPATELIEDLIRETLNAYGFRHISLIQKLSPAWTTDWITPDGKEKLRAYGIAPPKSNSKLSLMGHAAVVSCPVCGSSHTQQVSEFGSTACKALYRCLDCLEPFDYFKCI